MEAHEDRIWMGPLEGLRSDAGGDEVASTEGDSFGDTRGESSRSNGGRDDRLLVEAESRRRAKGSLLEAVSFRGRGSSIFFLTMSSRPARSCAEWWISLRVRSSVLSMAKARATAAIVSPGLTKYRS